jgi:ABC-type branched-subunit amino acid transport system substrate-binding protein
VTDHDPRPPARYSDLDLVTSPAPGSALTASDVGITATTITVGIMLVGLGSISALGIDTSSLDPAVQRTYWEDAFARVNAAGGIDGRRVTAVYATGDILSTDSMRAACRDLTEDHRVFAVANVLGVSGDPILCVTRDHATPMLAIAGADASYYSLSVGRLVTLEASINRTLTILANGMTSLGLVRGHRIGIVHDAGAGGVDITALRRVLLAAGATAVFDGPLSGEDPLVVTGQVTAAEERMQQAGVDTVLLLTNAVYGTVFATQADQTRFTPTYVMSDLGYATAGDSFLANMPASFFRRAVAFTTTEVGRGRASLPESKLDAGCRADYARLSGKADARDSADAIAAMASCALVQLLTMGLDGAGPNPTRVAFTDALADAGSFAVPGIGRGLLGPGHLDAADEVSVVTAHGDCQCFVVTDGFRPLS